MKKEQLSIPPLVHLFCLAFDWPFRITSIASLVVYSKFQQAARDLNLNLSDFSIEDDQWVLNGTRTCVAFSEWFDVECDPAAFVCSRSDTGPVRGSRLTHVNAPPDHSRYFYNGNAHEQLEKVEDSFSLFLPRFMFSLCLPLSLPVSLPLSPSRVSFRLALKGRSLYYRAGGRGGAVDVTRTF